MKKPSKISTLLVGALLSISSLAKGLELKIGDSAPEFKSKTQDGADFDLASRKGSWTVLYFYPKAGTPGCTKQACAFRDSIKKITDLGAGVFGVSADTVEAQKKFANEHHLNFTLLADPNEEIIKAYGTKMPLLPMSKRWTFILGPDLKVHSIEKDVDPVLDAERTAKQIAQLQSASKK